MSKKVPTLFDYLENYFSYRRFTKRLITQLSESLVGSPQVGNTALFPMGLIKLRNCKFYSLFFISQVTAKPRWSMIDFVNTVVFSL